MVHITRVYTRTGDAGTTRLSNNQLTQKTDLRVQAYGQVDETNCTIGVALSLKPGAQMTKVLQIVQNELFDVGADLSNPVLPDPKYPPLRVQQSSVDRLEHWIDEFGENLPALRSFILPGGSPLAAQLHVARATARRAEIAAWAAVDSFGIEDGHNAPAGGVNIIAVKYLNRLSDLLFNLSRAANVEAEVPEVLWVPEGERVQ